MPTRMPDSPSRHIPTNSSPTDQNRNRRHRPGKETDNTNPEDLPDYIRPFTHSFNKKNFDQLPKQTEWDHQINLTKDASSEISSKVYNMTPQEKEELNKFLDKNITSQRIKPSNSSYAAPCFFVPKKDGSLRLCQDYRKLNNICIKDKTPLPLISEVIDQLKDAKYFNKLDIIQGLLVNYMDDFAIPGEKNTNCKNAPSNSLKLQIDITYTSNDQNVILMPQKYPYSETVKLPWRKRKSKQYEIGLHQQRSKMWKNS
jgi:hypothetical protein